MFSFLEILVMVQYAVTALSSVFNAVYFWSYRSPRRRRRVGAMVLTVISLAMFIQSLYFGSFFFLQEQRWRDSLLLDARHWLMAGALSALGSLLISALILRQLTNKANH